MTSISSIITNKINKTKNIKIKDNKVELVVPERVPVIIENYSKDRETPYSLKDIETMLVLVSYLFKHDYDANGIDDINKFENIHHKLFFSLLGQNNYSFVKSELISMGIIEFNKSYRAGYFSQGYKIHDNFIYDDPIRVLINNPYVIRQIKTSLNKNNSVVADKYSFVKYMENMRVDEEAAMKWLDEQDYEERMYHSYKLAIQRVNHAKEFDYYSISKLNGRLTSYLTNFPRNLKPFVYYLDEEGNKITKKIVIDAKNSQPFILLVLLEKYKLVIDEDFRKEILAGNFYNYMTNLIQDEINKEQELINKNKKSIIQFLLRETNIKLIEKMDIKRWMVEDYLFKKGSGSRLSKSKLGYGYKLVFDGESFKEVRTDKEYARTPKEDEMIKKTIYDVFKKKFNKTYESVKKLKLEILPNLPVNKKRIEENEKNLKIEYSKINKKYDKSYYERRDLISSIFACTLQTIESDLWLNKIVNKVNEITSKAYFYTVHDSIVFFNINDDEINRIKEQIKNITLSLFNHEIPLHHEIL